MASVSWLPPRHASNRTFLVDARWPGGPGSALSPCNDVTTLPAGQLGPIMSTRDLTAPAVSLSATESDVQGREGDASHCSSVVCGYYVQINKTKDVKADDGGEAGCGHVAGW